MGVCNYNTITIMIVLSIFFCNFSQYQETQWNYDHNLKHLYVYSLVGFPLIYIAIYHMQYLFILLTIFPVYGHNSYDLLG